VRLGQVAVLCLELGESGLEISYVLLSPRAESLLRSSVLGAPVLGKVFSFGIMRAFTRLEQNVLSERARRAVSRSCGPGRRKCSPCPARPVSVPSRKPPRGRGWCMGIGSVHSHFRRVYCRSPVKLLAGGPELFCSCFEPYGGIERRAR
jgi:hypothetical protein